MSVHHEVVINYDAVLEGLRRTVRRSAIMMGIGINSAEVQPRISHMLSHDGPFGIRLVPEDVDEDVRAHFAEEFAKWVKANGLRELLEGFSIYLHELYTSLFFVRWKASGSHDAGLMAPHRFELRGLADQLDQLSKLLAVDDRSKVILASLNQARNCYAHRRGRVGIPDLKGGVMVVSWNRFAFSVREPDGNIVPEGEVIGRFLPKGGQVLISVVEEQREFSEGQELILEKEELKQICLFVQQLGEGFYNQAVQMAIDAGLLQPPTATSK